MKTKYAMYYWQECEAERDHLRAKLATAEEVAAQAIAALVAVHAGFMDGSIKWAKPRQADSEPYHPANTLMSAALARAKVQP